jgi:succinylglutamate desuccinylase
LGEEEGISLEWIFKVHPAFSFHDDIKERLIAMMTKDNKEIKLAIFPNTINFKRVKDGKVMSTTGVTLQVARTEGITSTEFRANMAKKWQHFDAKTGGSLFGKKFTP